uniref:Junctional protein associated with coronary artery disease n=1 Tax=Sus scrofa TaxID=9823 RepID=A0A8D0PJS5_PIG
MYSVEDLLVSHGYKLSRSFPAPQEEDGEGRQQTRTRVRAGPGLPNGCEDGPASLPRGPASPGPGRLSDSESHRRGLRVHGEPPSTAAARIAEPGFYHQPVLAWSSQPLTGRSHAYWRRREQEAGPRAAEDLPLHAREGPWEVGGRTEHVMKKATWEEELGSAGPAKWQHPSLGSWNQPRKLERQMSDGVREQLFQDLYPFMLGEHVLTSQSKGKSRSLPRVLSPESLSCMEIPIPLSDGHLAGVPKVLRHPPKSAHDLEATRNPEKGPFPRPKFGRPLKPTAHDSHQHSRPGEQNSSYADGQQPDPCVSYLTRASDTRQELCGPDPGLEPPVYVPPPSYRSPLQHTSSPCVEDASPGLEGGGRRVQQHRMEKAAASHQLPTGSPAAGSECSASPRSPRGLPQQLHPSIAYDGSIVYIPFDDPRIRHLKLARPQGFWEEMKLDSQPCRSGPVPAPEPEHGSGQRGGAIRSPQGLMGPSGKERGPAPADPSPPWLWGQLPRDGENGGLPDPRDHCVVTHRQWPDTRGHAESRAASASPQSESACETHTQLRKFETGVQTKKSSKKKLSETIFCLVSIPVKSESQLPDIDTNNNDLKQGTDKKNGLDKNAALQVHSLLSLPSTDLELQTLPGSQAGRMGLPKPDPGGPGGDKHTNGLRFTHPAKHSELPPCPGWWPGHQYRDQQTQTSFTEEPQSPQPLPEGNVAGSPHAPLTPGCLDPAPQEVQIHMALASSDQNQRPGAHPLKGQGSLSPSSNSAFSRSSSAINPAPVPRAGLGQLCMDSPARGASPVPRGEVVKGETTGPCNSKQLFGQFLLKPVSRRPWDLISQLESFNKELQEEEESSPSSDGSSEGSDSELPGEAPAGPTPKRPGFLEDRVEEAPRRPVPEASGLRSGRVKSKSESWSEELKPLSPCPVWAEDHAGAAWLSPRGSVISEQGALGVQDGVTEPAVNLRPGKPLMSSGLSEARPVPQHDPAAPREPPQSQELPDGPSAVQSSGASPPEASSGEQGSTGVSPFLASKPRGLSAPDLRSVGLTLAQEQRASEPAGPPTGATAVEIPLGESLQARAARILGIEVAVESLLPGTRRTGLSQHPEPGGGACQPESPGQESGSGPAQPDDLTSPADAFYGRRKCGWTKSPLFVGERDSAWQAPQASEPSGMSGPSKAPEPQPSPLESQPFHHRDMETKPPFRSTLFHFIERTPSVAASEKRLRSTSKVIESLQEKLASPPRRADPDRLLRMKEVSSVSRLRLLTSRGVDSAEEAEEPKAERGPGARLGCLAGTGYKLSDPKGALSLEEGHLAAGREENGGQDFWCPDSYDPSRVERV